MPASDSSHGDLVSIVVPTYNRAHLIGRTLESVLAQTYSNWECLVVDDGSTDDTAEVVRSFDDPRIRYLPLAQNSGASVSRNHGIEASKGRFIAFLDSDDEWLPEKLELQVDLFNTSELNPGVTYTDAYKVDARSGRQRLVSPRLRGDVFQKLLFRLRITFSTVVVKRELFDIVGPLDEAMPRGMDRDLMIRLAQVTNFDGVPEPLARQHNRHGPNLKGSLDLSVVYKRRLVQKLREMEGVPPSALAYHHRSLGLLLARQGDHHAAATEMLSSIRTDPMNPRPYVHLARISLASVGGGRPKADGT